ncbi:MAG: palindromic element RPE4 domain-containing protein [Gammaproteobacteria bacterium]|nr:palindromic element RPE4 domain-containing protein [Gammaproteobacteria bacterium]
MSSRGLTTGSSIGDACCARDFLDWIPAFAGMTCCAGHLRISKPNSWTASTRTPR